MRKERTCISCGEKAEGNELLRWFNFKGKILPDWLGNLEGRSIYTHYSKECVEELYNRKKFSSKFYEGNPEYFYSQDKIFMHIAQQAQKSFGHFLSLARKSGAVIKGQNFIISKLKEGTDIKHCFYALDTSSNTEKLMKKNVDGAKQLMFAKKDLGSYFDGRDTAVFALDSSQLSDKIVFYIKVFEKFISGDIDANK